MIIQLHRPEGVLEVDIETVTDAEWQALGMIQETLDEYRYQEQLADKFNSAHEQGILALNNWSSLTLAQKELILKNLLEWALWKDGWLKLGVLT